MREQAAAKGRKILASLDYPLRPVEKGYANRSLYVNLTDRAILSKPVTDEMKEIFIGGRGFGLWYLWNAVTEKTKWDDPENEIVISAGPIGGITQYPGAGKSIVVTLSPTTGTVIDSNVGGHFGPLLKFSGWDALEIQGQAEKDVIIFIDGNAGRVTIEEAGPGPGDSHLIIEQLMDIYAPTEEDKRHVSVVTTGTGAEHSLIGMLNFSFYDPHRKIVRVKQAGRGGTGTVFRAKKIRALV
ncbi:MAG: aldehyde:ferredoxin oxidoreductase, partial [Moorella sp. (in: Bacteria)]|nr:aldehyde:ferredoxin oxidoreductase [Moorella sp. (in: firmicutes)]